MIEEVNDAAAGKIVGAHEVEPAKRRESVRRIKQSFAKEKKRRGKGRERAIGKVSALLLCRRDEGVLGGGDKRCVASGSGACESARCAAGRWRL
jgi:hypothetical protein